MTTLSVEQTILVAAKAAQEGRPISVQLRPSGVSSLTWLPIAMQMAMQLPYQPCSR